MGIIDVSRLFNAHVNVRVKSMANSIIDLIPNKPIDEAIMEEANMAAINLIKKFENKCDSNECYQFATFLEDAPDKVLCPTTINSAVIQIGIDLIWVLVCVGAIISIGYYTFQRNTKASQESYQLLDHQETFRHDSRKSSVTKRDIKYGALCLSTTTVTVSVLDKTN